ncbi:hypothetical protein [Citrobacter portucalensis]|uniref:hypothetical protein n=1 Tax=Citrobacter portucalensis TaxID=1639133 RepID=UPI001781BEFC|nr:hypothetical protein [Citrobacter portucalensis]MDT7481470.1 hypothetical protein [Citrobacter portucalensis]URR14590.1 hypothetical protein LT980_08410 [Citrobacter portucalensis]
MKRFSQHEKKGVTRLHQLRQDDAETFQEVLLFFLQHTSKVDKLLAEFRDNAHFLCGGEKNADAKTPSACQIQQRQQTAFFD